MLISELLQIRPVALTELHNVGEALKVLASEGVSCLPVIHSSEETWLGNVYLDRLLDHHKSQKLTEIIFPDEVCIQSSQHVMDAITTIMKFNVDLLPVISYGNHYEGFIERQQIADVIQRHTGGEDVGSVLFLEIAERDYTLSNIVRLIEVEDAKILGVLVQPPQIPQGNFRISIKINLQDASRISESLHRHGYVVSNPSGELLRDTEIEQRADELMHFLEL